MRKPNPFNALFRSSCSECSSKRLRWMGLGEACDRLGFDQVNELMGRMPPMNESESEEVEWWQCMVCGHFGAMGPVQIG